MKKSSIALYVAAALFLVCSFTFLPDKIAEFVSGVVIAAVLAFFGYRQQKKPAAAKEEEAPVPAAPDPAPAPVVKPEPAASVKEENAAPPESPYEFLTTKIAGVTFKDGRKSRQTILRRLYWKDEPFDKNAAEVTLDRGEYEGKPAFAVLLNDEKAGYVPAEYSQFLEDNFERCDGVTHISAYHGASDIYGAEITIRFRKI